MAAGELLDTQVELAALRKQALDFLLVLGRRPGEVVSKDELIRASYFSSIFHGTKMTWTSRGAIVPRRLTQPASTLNESRPQLDAPGQVRGATSGPPFVLNLHPLEENDMNRNLPSTIAAGAVTTIALLAAAVIASTPAYADEEQFVSSRTREEVSAELKIPYPGGNPWSGSYNMFQKRSTATREQVQGEYTANRDRANAFHGEDSGSMYIMKAQGSLAPTTAAMGAPAR